MAQTNNAVAVYQPRLRMPAQLSEFDERKWRVLTDAIFPAAKTAEAIVMAIDYCKARNLDVFRKPVHIVPMWNSALGREVETVWPGINEVQVTAARTGQFAGMDEPKWGPDITKTFKGYNKKEKKNEEVTVTYPEWCTVTVYRMVGGVRCPFSEPVYWIEAYSRAFGTELPTSMWVKRPRGQVHKVAKAASLRSAFPEEGEYTAEEMEGKEIEHGGVVIEHAPQPARASPPSPPPAPKTNGNGLTEAEERALDRQSMREMRHESPEPEFDSETGEIIENEPPASDIPPGREDPRWSKWGDKAVAAFHAEKSAMGLSRLLQRNERTLEQCKEAAPNVYDRVIATYRNRQGYFAQAPITDATELV